MPELPEVETIRRQLSRVLSQKKITHVDVRLPKMVRGTVRALQKVVTGARIISIGRRGKYLLWRVSGGHTVIIHLKMTGQLVYLRHRTMRVGGHPIPGGTTHLPNRYSHVIFSIAGGGTVYFNDQRRFGFVESILTTDEDAYFTERKMGPEPLQPSFTEEYFIALTTRRAGTTIKQLLLDQTAIAGIGNIYALEALFDARVRPARRVSTLTSTEIKRLYRSIKKILQRAVRAQGASANTYVDAYGNPGKYVPKLAVYGRGGEPCRHCGTIIKRITLGGRGTMYCPQCQR